MASSAAHKMANTRYRQNRRATITADVAKDKYDVYKAKAAGLGLSMSQLIQRGVESYGVDNNAVPTTTTEPALTADQRKILSAVDKLPPPAQKALIKFLQTLQDNA